MAVVTMKAATRAMAKLFRGHPGAYGEGGAFGRCYPVPDAKQWPGLWVGHFEGDAPIGVYCVAPGNVTSWGCVDVDDIPHQFEVTTNAVAILEELGVIPFVELSRSKGFHIWWFYESVVEAWTVRMLGLEMCRRLGVTLEVNPKQEELSETLPYGNYVRCAYPAKWEQRKRQCFIDGGYLLTPNQFLADVEYSNPLRTRGEAIRSPLCPPERALGFRWPSLTPTQQGGTEGPARGGRGIDQEAANILFRGMKVTVGSRDNQLWTTANLMWGVGMTKQRAVTEMERIWSRQVDQNGEAYALSLALSKVDRVYAHRAEKPPRPGELRPLPPPKVFS